MQGNFNYIVIFLILVSGLYGCFASNNLIKKIMSLSIFQSAILLFYISLGKVNGAGAPVLKCLNFEECPQILASPLPHILMLTAIVVGIATISVAFAIIIRLKKKYGTIDENEIILINEKEDE